MKAGSYEKDFFKIIDTELKAYILGYVVADGCITIESRNDRPSTSTIKRVQFQSCMEDFQVLELIRNTIAPDSKLTILKSKQLNHQDIVRLRLANIEIVNDLMTLHDIKPRKTYYTEFKFPNMPQELKRHFIRGFIDGDGSIGDRHFSMICNSMPFLIDILKCFKDEIPDLKHYIYQENRKYTTYYSLHFSVNRRSRLQLFNFLYKDCSYKLGRKFEKAHNAVLNSKSKELLSV